MVPAAILDLFEPEIAPLDPPSPKTLPSNQTWLHEVDRITRCRDMAIRVCWGHMEPPFWGEGEVIGGQQWTMHGCDAMEFAIGSPL